MKKKKPKSKSGKKKIAKKKAGKKATKKNSSKKPSKNGSAAKKATKKKAAAKQSAAKKPSFVVNVVYNSTGGTQTKFEILCEGGTSLTVEDAVKRADITDSRARRTLGGIAVDASRALTAADAISGVVTLEVTANTQGG